MALGFSTALPGPMLSGLSGRPRRALGPPPLNFRDPSMDDMAGGTPMPNTIPAFPTDPRLGLDSGPQPSFPVNGVPPASLGSLRRPIGQLEQAFTSSTPEEQDYQNLREQGPTPTKAGIWNRIKASLLSGGLAAAAAGNQNPETQGAALLGGMIGGGVSRGFGGNIRHNLLDLPRARGLADESREIADAGLNRRMGFSRAFGYDPETGEPTADTTRYEEERAFRDREAAQRHEYQQAQLQRKTPAWEQDAAGNWVDLNTAPPGVRGPARNVPNVQTVMTEAGLMERDPATGIWRPAPTQDGGPLRSPASSGLTPYQQSQIARQDQQDAIGARKEATEIKGKFESLKTKATTMDAEWRELQKAAGMKPGAEGYVRWKGRWYTPDELETMRDEKEVEANAAAREFNDFGTTLEGHPYIKRTSPTAIAINEEALRSIGRRGGQSGGGTGGKVRGTATQQDVADYAAATGKSLEAARKAFEAEGWQIQ